MYYISDDGVIAKLLSVDNEIATIVVNDKAIEMAWDEFIKEFNGIGIKK